MTNKKDEFEEFMDTFITEEDIKDAMNLAPSDDPAFDYAELDEIQKMCKKAGVKKNG